MNKKVTAIGGLAALAVVGGTWAFFNQTTTIHNELTTKGKYGMETTEKFNPGSDWEAGSTVDKNISVKNTGNGAILVRVKMDEAWQYTDEEEPFITWDSTSSEEGKREGFFRPMELPAQDGNPLDDWGTVVHKNWDFDNIAGEPVKNAEEKWYLADDGYMYYCKKLEKGSETKDLLKSITLDANTDMGIISNTYYYKAVEKGNEEPGFDLTWEKMSATNAEDAQEELKKIVESEPDKDYYMTVETKTDDENKGYSDASYTLNITTDAIQATPEAVAEEWQKGNNSFPTELIEAILGEALPGGTAAEDENA